MAEDNGADWVEWEAFISDFIEGRVGRDHPPPIPAVIQAFLDREEIKSGQLVPLPVAVDAHRPQGAKGVSRAETGCRKS